MNMASAPFQIPVPQEMPPSVHEIPSPPPIKYSITQHYHHSAHHALSTTTSVLPNGQGATAEETLLRHHINPSSLFPSQYTLFVQADTIQKARLIELWQIAVSKSSTKMDTSPVPQASNTDYCGQKVAAMETRKPYVREIDMDEDKEEANRSKVESFLDQDAEPYVISGYEILMMHDHQPLIELPSRIRAMDPVYKRALINA